MSGAPIVPTQVDANYQKKLDIQVLEVLCQRYRLWLNDLDRRTDLILAADISTLSKQELDVFDDLNDLWLDLNRVAINVTHARNISVITPDTEGTE